MIKNIIKHFSISLTTFVVSIGIASIGFVLQQATQSQIIVKNRLHVFEQVLQEDNQIVENGNRLAISDNSQTDSYDLHLHELLSEIVKSYGRKKNNTFYISKFETDYGKRFWVYVYWKEDNSIMTLSSTWFQRENLVYLPILYGDRHELEKNIVHTEEEIGNSTKLLTRKLAKDLINKCVSNGIKITIDKRKQY